MKRATEMLSYAYFQQVIAYGLRMPFETHVVLAVGVDVLAVVVLFWSSLSLVLSWSSFRFFCLL